MKITRHALASLEQVYSIAVVDAGSGGDPPAFVAGSEGDGALLLFAPPAYEPVVIADGPGGFISLRTLQRGGRRYVVAATDFKPTFKAENCRIIVYPLDESGRPAAVEVAALPFTHRVAVCEVAAAQCFLGSTLCAAKAFKDDWTQPGAIHLAVLPEDPSQPWRTRQIVPGLNKNHGMDYARLDDGGGGGFLLSAMEGLFYLRVPERPEDDWPTERIAAGEHSDAYAYDWDGSGTPDIFTLRPFHGNLLSVYRRSARGWEATVIDDDIQMGHIVWAGELLGKPGLIAAGRQGDRDIRLYRPGSDDPWKLTRTVIDEDVGPTQMAVLDDGGGSARLIVAGHGCDEVLMYDLGVGPG